MEENYNTRKPSLVKNVFDPLECWNICRKDGTRQYSSVSKVRSKLNHHDSEKDKTLVSIQRKLEALSSVQTSINGDIKSSKSENKISPPRQLSARRVRKGVIYRPTERIKHNIIELKSQHICQKCKVTWVSSLNKKTCELCTGGIQGLAFELEFKMPTEDNKNAILVIGDREIPVNLSSRFKYIISVPPIGKTTIERNKTFDIEIGAECNEFSRIPTPSFHLNTERMEETSSFFAGEVSFSEHSRAWQDLSKEIEKVTHRQFTVLESPSLGKVKELCDNVGSDYSKIFKKISSFLYNDIGVAVEKTSKGLLSFFDSCVISLLKYISQLQDKNSMAKDSEQQYVVRIASLTKLLQKYQDTPKRSLSRFA